MGRSAQPPAGPCIGDRRPAHLHDGRSVAFRRIETHGSRATIVVLIENFR